MIYRMREMESVQSGNRREDSIQNNNSVSAGRLNDRVYRRRRDEWPTHTKRNGKEAERERWRLAESHTQIKHTVKPNNETIKWATTAAVAAAAIDRQYCRPNDLFCVWSFDSFIHFARNGSLPLSSCSSSSSSISLAVTRCGGINLLSRHWLGLDRPLPLRSAFPRTYDPFQTKYPHRFNYTHWMN